MADSKTKEAANYTRDRLPDLGFSEPGLCHWVRKYIPKEKLHTLKNYQGWEQLTPVSDEGLVKTVKIIQEWVYGTEGDKAAGVEAKPATDAEMDGKLGRGTYARMITWEEEVEPPSPPKDIPEGVSYIVANGEKIPVPGVKIVHDLYSFEEACKGGKRCYGLWKDGERTKEGSHQLPSSVTCLATVHWDVCGSSKTCFKVLKKNGLSSCFGVDNADKNGEVVVYQWLDFGSHYGYHGGVANKHSLLSFDLCNLVSLKHASKYDPPRPRIFGDAHGRKKELLGHYKGQILAVLRICKAVAERWPKKFKLEFPAKGGMPISTVVDGLLDGGYPGVHTHMAITENKWDVTAFVDQIIYLMIKEPAVAEEFPTIAKQFDVTNEEKWSKWVAERDKNWTWAEVQG